MTLKSRSVKIVFALATVGVIVLLTRSCLEGDGDTRNEKDKDQHAPAESDSSTRPESRSEARSSSPIEGFLAAYQSKIELYGKVVDQFGDPVPGAEVHLTPVDVPFGDESKSRLTINSESDGSFSVKGLRGSSMGVQTSKEGYHYIQPLDGPASFKSVSYGAGAEDGKRFSDPATPLVLTLYKIGPIEPMAHVDAKRWRLPVDGSLARIALDSEEGEGLHQIEFRFESDWNQLPKTNEMYGKQYSWSFEARVPGGGFIWSGSDYDFMAPESVYKETIRYHYPVITNHYPVINSRTNYYKDVLP